MSRITAALLSLLLAVGPAMASDGDHAPDQFEGFAPQSGTFSCEMPSGWTVFEEDTPRGTAVHLLGPEQSDGVWRAAYHIHHFEKAKGGFLPAKDLLKKLRGREKASERQATAMTSWRISHKPARLFEVREERMLPYGRLPASIVPLHHFYAVIPTGPGEYFLVKLSTTEDAYLEYRLEFQRFLKNFQITAY